MTTQTKVLTFDDSCNPSTTDISGFFAPTSDLAASSLAYAMASNNADSINGRVGAFYLVDGFEIDSLATKINANYDVEGNYYHNTGNFASGGTASASTEFLQYFASNAFDSNLTTTRWVSTATPAWLEYDRGTDKGVALNRITIQCGSYNHASISDMPKDFTVEGYNGSTWDVLTTVTGESAWSLDQQRIYSFSNSTVYEKIKLNISANQGGDTGESEIGELEFLLLLPADMTLASTAMTLDVADPDCIAAYIVIAPQETITVGTDIVMTMSIDGGTTDATGTWTKVGDLGSSGEQLWRIDADVSTQTGSSLIWEITTHNNKEIRLNGIVGLITQ